MLGMMGARHAYDGVRWRSPSVSGRSDDEYTVMPVTPLVTPNTVTQHGYATYAYVGHAKFGYATWLRNMLMPRMVMSITPNSVTPHGYATYGTPSLRGTPLLPRLSTASLPASLLASLPVSYTHLTLPTTPYV